jgi:hypothetical protein
MPTSPPPGADLDLFRIVCAVAWADGDFAPEERDLLERLIRRYTGEAGRQAEADSAALAHEPLRPAALEALVPRLGSEEDRELALKLSHMMVRIGRRSADEAIINPPEKAAYRRLVELLGLPQRRVEQIEWAAAEELEACSGILDVLAQRFRHLLGAGS